MNIGEILQEKIDKLEQESFKKDKLISILTKLGYYGIILSE